MKLYKPVLIESAEQAEALPAGTLARHSEGAGMDHAHKIAAMPGLMGSHWVSSMGVESNAAMVGWTALVPIEAEEEWTAMGSDHGDPWIAHVGHDGIDGSREEAQRYVDRFGGFIAHRTCTPWEEAQ